MIGVLVLLVAGLVSGKNICPDGTECQDKNTCCPTKTGYACCQYPSAVCCPDKAHCCPQGYQCNLEAELCEKRGISWYKIPLSSQIPAQEEKKTASAPLVKSDEPHVSVVFCDNTLFCPDGTTCCRSPFGQWFCCPYTVGQCCFDGIHCCPFGFRCDSTSSQCFRGALRFPASPQIAAMQSNNIQDQCCQSETGCCAIGFHCDEESKTCMRDFEYLSPSKSMLGVHNQAGVIHCSDQFYCPAGNSCCKTSTGQVACCPYPLGRCCKDGKHCCEYGYDCDSTYTKCIKGYSSVPARLTKEAWLR